MRFRALWAVLVVPAIISFLEPATAAPLETYGRLPSVEDVALSPSGKRLAFVRTRENQRLIAIADLPNTLLTRMNFGEVKLRRHAWADDDHLMITTSTRKLHTYPDRADRDIKTVNVI